ncbi:MAG: neutral zinc metallopeptidase, partial [Clostridia bacterium]|nr:neutral zinc metallopeptidase [Deltaproteobacteria bacterium]
MRLGGYRESSNVDDRRGFGGRGMRIGGLGAVGTIIVAVAAMLLGVDPREFLAQIDTSPQTQMDPSRAQGPRDDEERRFVARVLASTEDVWGKTVKGYTDPNLVLFSNKVQSACGIAGTSSGPFYCPRDRKVYLDLAFYRELTQR